MLKGDKHVKKIKEYGLGLGMSVWVTTLSRFVQVVLI